MLRTRVPGHAAAAAGGGARRASRRSAVRRQLHRVREAGRQAGAGARSGPGSPTSTTARWCRASWPADSVLILPSASLVQSQQELQQRMQPDDRRRRRARHEQAAAHRARRPRARRAGGVAMLVGEIIAVALQAIRANKLRSLLTMLGIVIGVGAVITMVALGSGAQKAVEDRIACARRHAAHHLSRGRRSAAGVAHQISRVSLTMDDDLARPARRAAHQGGRARDAAQPPGQVRQPEHEQPGRRHDRQLPRGAELHAPVRPHVHRRRGREPAALRRAGRGRARAARRQRRGDDRPGHPDRGIPFEVIGVLSRKGSAGSFQNPDEQILIPLQTARFRVLRHRPPALDVGPGGRRRARRTGHGGHRAHPAPRAPDPAGRRERLPDPQPGGLPDHAAGDDAGRSRSCWRASRP